MKKIIELPNGRRKVVTINNEPSMTQQQYKDDCDINKIIEKYEKTGEFVHKTSKTGVYADFTQITDYQTMLHKVMSANEAFMTLPAKVRAKFQNDPQELIEFLNDPQNKSEAIELGLIEKKAPEQKNEPNDKMISASKSKSEKTDSAVS